ncbi:hypothetical protein [Chroococcidiopsis sp [FACHB-1243]]|nr:hypothetical protein [Chroococcidiopsis sp. [FACHB-1243]]
MRGEEDKGDKEAEEQGAGEQLPTTNYQLPIPNSLHPFFTNN